MCNAPLALNVPFMKISPNNAIKRYVFKVLGRLPKL